MFLQCPASEGELCLMIEGGWVYLAVIEGTLYCNVVHIRVGDGGHLGFLNG